MNPAEKLYPLCGDCESALAINTSKIGDYICCSCGVRWFEDVNDETTYRDEQTGLMPPAARVTGDTHAKR